MAFTASIVNKGIVDKTFQVGVSYSNGSFQFVESIDMTGGSLQGLSDRVAARLATLNTTESLIPSVTVGPFTPTTVTLTAPQIAQNTFMADYQLLQAMNRGIAAGVKTSADADYVAQLAKVKGEYLPAYNALL